MKLLARSLPHSDRKRRRDIGNRGNVNIGVRVLFNDRIKSGFRKRTSKIWSESEIYANLFHLLITIFLRFERDGRVEWLLSLCSN